MSAAVRLERLAHLVDEAAEVMRAASLTSSRPRPATTAAAMTTAAQRRGAGWRGWHHHFHGLQCHSQR